MNFKFKFQALPNNGNVFGRVYSVNGKIDAVTLNAEDVGADPLGSAQAVQENVDAEIKPQINELRADVDLIQPQLESLSDNKLDKVDYVQHFLGVFSSKAALDAAHPTARAGDSADIDSGSGFDVMRAIWDDSDQQWVIREVNNAQNTDQVSEGNTNLYFKAERVLATLLSGFNPVNTAINAADSIIQGLSKAQGQIGNIISTFAANVRSTTLAGLNTSVGGLITSADTHLSAFGKLQNQIINFVVPPTVWVPIATVATVQSYVSVNNIELARIDGNLWIRGSFQLNANVGAADFITITDNNYKTVVPNPADFNFNRMANITVFTNETPTTINYRISANRLTHTIQGYSGFGITNSQMIIQPTCIGKLLVQ